jgi:hypothetical protein
MPFPYTLYDQTFTSVYLSSNGTASFTNSDSAPFGNQCLPSTQCPEGFGYTIYPYWDNQATESTGYGVYTSVSGNAPNRIFNIEWRTQAYWGSGIANYELRLYEGQARFDVIYGQMDNGNTAATAGVQKDNSNFTQYFCDGSGGEATGGQSYTLEPCSSPTPTPTPTPTPACAAEVQPPINADGTSIFNGNRGIVPVKFRLTCDGQPSCDLPPAMIAVTRTAGGVIGEINESVYSSQADSGSNFRTLECQYHYNLDSRALGVGTYRVDILIDGQVVGNATFELN